jgi:hypothetical protein
MEGEVIESLSMLSNLRIFRITLSMLSNLRIFRITLSRLISNLRIFDITIRDLWKLVGRLCTKYTGVLKINHPPGFAPTRPYRVLAGAGQGRIAPIRPYPVLVRCLQVRARITRPIRPYQDLQVRAR